jgi:hypothetical protein
MSPSKIFVSYAHEDENFRLELLKHLRLIEKQGYVKSWHDREITAGEEWREEVDQHLRDADIILLLVSADFVNSEYCYDIEMQTAIEAHNSGKKLVIPILVRPVANWEEATFGKLQVLPTNTKPVSNWDSLDAAWADVVSGIFKAVQRREQEQLPRNSRKKPNFDQLFQSISSDQRTSDVKGQEFDKSMSDTAKTQLLYSIPMMHNKLSGLRAQQKEYEEEAIIAYHEIMGRMDSPLPFELQMTLIMSKLSDMLHKKVSIDILKLSIVDDIEKAKLTPSLVGWPTRKELSLNLEKDLKNSGDILNGLLYLTGVPKS